MKNKQGRAVDLLTSIKLIDAVRGLALLTSRNLWLDVFLLLLAHDRANASNALEAPYRSKFPKTDHEMQC